MSIVPLDRKKHASLTFKSLEDYSFVAAVNAVPLLAFEVVEASRCFAVVFPNPKTAIPHALLGLGNRNIFVDGQGRWNAPYLPLFAANYPFSLTHARKSGETAQDEPALAIEEDAPHFHQENGLPLYGEDGEPTPLLRRILSAMGNQYRRHTDNEKALGELALSNVLGERVVAVRHMGEERLVGGLRVANREKVMALPDATLARWARNGLLDNLLAHWQSMRNLRELLDDPSCPSSRAARAKQ